MPSSDRVKNIKKYLIDSQMVVILSVAKNLVVGKSASYETLRSLRSLRMTENGINQTFLKLNYEA